MKRIFYWIRAKYRAWRYKQKYGINIEDALLEYGRHVVLTEAVVLKCCGKSAFDCECSGTPPTGTVTILKENT